MISLLVITYLNVFFVLVIEYQKILMSDSIEISSFEGPKNFASAAYANCGLHDFYCEWCMLFHHLYCYIKMCFIILGIEYQKIKMSDNIDISNFERPQNLAKCCLCLLWIIWLVLQIMAVISSLVLLYLNVFCHLRHWVPKDLNKRQCWYKQFWETKRSCHCCLC